MSPVSHFFLKFILTVPDERITLVLEFKSEKGMLDFLQDDQEHQNLRDEHLPESGDIEIVLL